MMIMTVKIADRIKLNAGRNMKLLYKAVICLGISAILFICSLGISQAAVMPAYERLTPITASLDAPTAVAIDNYGCIFVAESINNRLLIYTQGGQYYQTLSGLQKPVSVAVDANGKIYIGNKNTGNVEVYSSGLSLLFKLGAGDGEFTQPAAIAVGSSGKVYVADSNEDVIKVYNADGTAYATFGSSGSGDGEFHFPTGPGKIVCRLDEWRSDRWPDVLSDEVLACFEAAVVEQKCNASHVFDYLVRVPIRLRVGRTPE